MSAAKTIQYTRSDENISGGDNQAENLAGEKGVRS
jgi:hypothetical protein